MAIHGAIGRARAAGIGILVLVSLAVLRPWPSAGAERPLAPAHAQVAPVSHERAGQQRAFAEAPKPAPEPPHRSTEETFGRLMLAIAAVILAARLLGAIV